MIKTSASIKKWAVNYHDIQSESQNGMWLISSLRNKLNRASIRGNSQKHFCLCHLGALHSRVATGRLEKSRKSSPGLVRLEHCTYIVGLVMRHVTIPREIVINHNVAEELGKGCLLWEICLVLSLITFLSIFTILGLVFYDDISPLFIRGQLTCTSKFETSFMTLT